ncbi:helix-turn-helix domain-containing protein [Demequina capsici]|uniref:Helix-turn-helix domain-containing protein n=1 Tax=Demequina capsici TaxID=3075620 RepID=A0AA96FB76_9MICO|nr:helix-turn-helix domain-containing protein [Demequina sp. PMTSA13]WNM26498.1 helix-turn-helix domain-containing protein [Demequina sp. PMTSA13]
MDQRRSDPPRTPRAARVVKAPDQRREEIVAAARLMFARQGVRATTFQHIADEAGVARSLVYHYAGSMDRLVDQVLDACVADFAAELRAWDAAREPGDIDGAVRSWLQLFRRNLPHTVDGAARTAHPLPRFDDAGLYVRYLDRSITALLDALEDTTIPAYAARHTIEITHVRETFALLLHGIIGLLRTNPALGDDVLADLVRQTLRLPPLPSRGPDRDLPTRDRDADR